MTCEEGAFQMGQDGLIEADDAGEPRFPGFQPVQKVVSQLGLDRAMDMSKGAELSQRRHSLRGLHLNEVTSRWG
ncbi:hypothetical protein GCM10010468_12930 [Actinocorallia longicatena]|uniref:Uncharacterized protein n=1 Tax=Actinocorallia longicatena TaxID=111803 RepID=A0ABP6Q720_9ACTN